MQLLGLLDWKQHEAKIRGSSVYTTPQSTYQKVQLSTRPAFTRHLGIFVELNSLSRHGSHRIWWSQAGLNSWVSPVTSPDKSSFPLLLFFGFFPNLKCEVQLLQVGLSVFIDMKLQKSPISLLMKCLMVSPNNGVIKRNEGHFYRKYFSIKCIRLCTKPSGRFNSGFGAQFFLPDWLIKM